MTSIELVFSKLFIAQMHEATTYYQTQASNEYNAQAGKALALKYTRDIEQLISAIKLNPNLYPPFDLNEDRHGYAQVSPYVFRHAFAAHFPYTLFYSADETTLYIEALYHQRSNYVRHLVSEIDAEQLKRLGLKALKKTT